ncbi:DUF4430 domain-containing protein [Bacillus sp. EB01]|uniref:DUF4430 domain-containing protein n=1 Tax=Bacillus sp. EB01 TaxID=1347086 RepID=UPI000694752D|nr:DUF4430 domain-containing protein [Bacillus sp. EB01]
MAVNRYPKLFVVLMLVFSLFAGVFPQHANAAASTVTVKVIGEQDAVLASGEAVLEEGETAYDALIKTVGADQVGVIEYSFGKMINSIKGLEAKDNYYWGFYTNGISSWTGADTFKPQSGDTLTFLYDNGAAAEKVNLEIIGNDKSTTKLYEGISYINEPNAFQLLIAMAGAENVTYDQYSFGKMISSIFGLKSDDTSFWSFYVNDEMQMIGAEDYPLQDGKTIQFKYETFTPPVEEPGDTEPGEENPAPGEENPAPGAEPYPAANLSKAVNNTFSYIQSNNQIGEWEAIALKQAGKPIPSGYLDGVAKRVIEREGKFRTITEYERYTLGILAAGGNPADFAGYNLVEGIYNGDFSKQGLNGAAYALIALDSANFDIPDNAKWNQEKLVTYLLANQGNDGGWGFDKEAGSDPDTTSMVLTALAPYKNDDQVKTAIDNGLQYLKGLFAASKVDNSPAAAQAVIALSALGIDANSDTITVDGKTLLAYLSAFQTNDGGFAWKSGDKSDVVSTTQGLQGLVAYQLYKDGKGSLYTLQLSETPVEPNLPEDEEQESEVPATPGTPAQPAQPAAPAAPNSEAPRTESPENGTVAESQGHRLPDTATDSYSLLALGAILLIAGNTLYSIRRRKQA